MIRALRHWVKRGLEIAIVRSGLADRMTQLPSRRRLILAYHNVVDDDLPVWGERALHIRRSLFQQHLEMLQSWGQIVPLRNLLEEPDDESEAGPRFALTFDDAYQGAVDAIRTLLVPRNIPSTVFFNPGLLGVDAFWWDVLAERFAGRIPATVRNRCLRELRGEQEKVLAWIQAKGWAFDLPTFPDYRPPTEACIEGLSNVAPPVKLSSHTWSHPNLTVLTSRERQGEVARAQSWLTARGIVDEPILLAYPYGLATREVQDEMGNYGHRFGLLVEGGHRFQPKRADGMDFAVPRLSVPAMLTIEGLAVRVAGLQ